jgi:hypothetical protein
MISFVVIFLALYGAMHALVFRSLQPLLAGHRLLPALVGCWMTLMVAAPLLVRLWDKNGMVGPARMLAWVGYCWMGFVFIAFSLVLLAQLWHVLVWLPGRVWPALACLRPGGAVTAAMVLLLSLAACLYGMLEARQLRVETVTLATAKLPAGSRSLRIVQVSDLHLGLLHRQEALAPVVAQVQRLAPDVLVVTGDMVDAQLDHLNGLSELWRRVEPPLGKFAVTGNHEAYAGLDQALAFLRRSGFTVLRGQAVECGEHLTLLGVDDPATGTTQNETDLLAGLPKARFTVLLKHRPRVASGADGRFDLQLSGHTHRGQIWPFALFTRLAYPLHDGLYQLPGGSRLYTNRGTGTWGPPMRLAAPPEITLFCIVPAASR